MALRILTSAFALASIGLSVAACGSHVTAVTGTIDKEPFSAVEAVSGTVKQGTSTMGLVTISTTGGACELFSSGVVHKNTKLIEIGLAQLDFASATVTGPKEPGEFTILDLNGGGTPAVATTAFAFVMYFELGSMCEASGEPTLAKSGTITIDSVDGDAYAGSGKVELSNGDHIEIEFDATACAALSNLSTEGFSGLQPKCE